MGELKTFTPARLDGARTPGPELARDLQQLWVSLLGHPWNSLALIPAQPGTSVVELARALAEAGARLGAPGPTVVELEGAELERVPHLLEGLARAVARGRAIVAVGGADDPAALVLARAADRAVLCVELGETGVADAQRTIALVGRERFLGSIAIRKGGHR